MRLLRRLRRRANDLDSVDRTRMEVPMLNAAEIERHERLDWEEAQARLTALNFRVVAMSKSAEEEL